MLSQLTAIPIIIAIWLVTSLFRLLPLAWCWKIGEGIGALCYKILPKRSAIIRANLETVAAHTKSFEVTDSLVKDVFKRNAANLVCAVKTYSMPVEKLHQYVTVEYDEHCTAAIDGELGGVFCLAHMGNWEILSSFGAIAGFGNHPIGAVYRPLDNKAADKYVGKQRSKSGCVMFPKQTSVNTLSSFIKSGGFLGILADQKAGGRKSAAPFFGRSTPRSKLPALLKKRTQGHFFSVCVSSPQPAHWRFQVELIPTPENASTEEILACITKSYEKNFADNLLDVFWLHRYWRNE